MVVNQVEFTVKERERRARSIAGLRHSQRVEGGDANPFAHDIGEIDQCNPVATDRMKNDTADAPVEQSGWKGHRAVRSDLPYLQHHVPVPI